MSRVISDPTQLTACGTVAIQTCDIGRGHAVHRIHRVFQTSRLLVCLYLASLLEISRILSLSRFVFRSRMRENNVAVRRFVGN